MTGEDEPGEEIFAEAGFFGGFCDDDVFFHGHRQVAGKDEVGDGVKEDD